MSSEFSVDRVAPGWYRPAQALRRRWFSFCLAFLLTGSAVCLLGMLSPREYRASTEFSWRIETQPLAVLRARNPDGLSAAFGAWLAAAQAPIIVDHDFRDDIGRIEARLVRGGPDEGAIEFLLSGGDARALARVARQRSAATRRMIEHDVRRLCDEIAAELRRERERRAQAVRTADEALHAYVAIMPSARAAGQQAHSEAKISYLSGADVLTTDELRTRLEEITKRIRTLETRRQELAIAVPLAGNAQVRPRQRPEGVRELESEIRAQETQLADLITIRRMTSEHPDVKAARQRLNQLHARREALLAEHALESAESDNSESEAVITERGRIDSELAAARNEAETAADALRAAMSGHAVQGADPTPPETVVAVAPPANADRIASAVISDADESTVLTHQGSPELQALVSQLGEARSELDAWNRRHASELESVTATTPVRVPGRENPVNCTTLRPDVLWLMILAILAGIVAGGIAVGIRERLDEVIRTPEQAEAEARAPILAVIDRAAGVGERARPGGAARVPALGLAFAILALSGYQVWTGLVRPDVSSDVEHTAFISASAAPPRIARSGERE